MSDSEPQFKKSDFTGQRGATAILFYKHGSTAGKTPIEFAEKAHELGFQISKKTPPSEIKQIRGYISVVCNSQNTKGIFKCTSQSGKEGKHDINDWARKGLDQYLDKDLWKMAGQDPDCIGCGKEDCAFNKFFGIPAATSCVAPDAAPAAATNLEAEECKCESPKEEVDFYTPEPAARRAVKCPRLPSVKSPRMAPYTIAKSPRFLAAKRCSEPVSPPKVTQKPSAASAKLEDSLANHTASRVLEPLLAETRDAKCCENEAPRCIEEVAVKLEFEGDTHTKMDFDLATMKLEEKTTIKVIAPAIEVPTWEQVDFPSDHADLSDYLVDSICLMALCPTGETQW